MIFHSGSIYIWLGVAMVFGVLGCKTTDTQHSGGSIDTPYGFSVQQPDNAKTPATLDIILPPVQIPRLQFQPLEADANPLPEALITENPKRESIRDSPAQLPSGAHIRISTGTPVDANAPAIEETKSKARRPLIYAGILSIIGGLFLATFFKYPTPGGLFALSGVLLIGLHDYPQIGLVAGALSLTALAIIVGYEAAERTQRSSNS